MDNILEAVGIDRVLLAARAGDDEAQRELVESYSRGVYNLGRVILGSELAESVLQEVFLAALTLPLPGGRTGRWLAELAMSAVQRRKPLTQLERSRAAQVLRLGLGLSESEAWVLTQPANPVRVAARVWSEAELA
ncbi:MAG: hypothetical protein JST54_24660 [Deltaproteobacteria bacterium]|nr:hypothetical protein [Deltaproteobacteria bacterium]